MFHGLHAYVSPSWYEVKPMAVPTWNYMAVHASGKARILTNDELELALHKLVDENETIFAQPWKLEFTEIMREKLLGAIVGFEIELVNIEGKFKLSQNRMREDQIRVIAQLAAQTSESSRQVAAQMKKNLGEQ
jgi:transcriptional regulator